MPSITIFDPSIASENLGDELIVDSVENQLRSIFDDLRFLRVQTHGRIGPTSYVMTNRSKHAFLGGSNLLSSNLFRDSQWKITIRDSIRASDSILLGIGWRQYQKKPSRYSKIILKQLLSSEYTHSVRDSYTKTMLESIGINNIINTGCPTLWGIDEEHCNDIPLEKSDNVIFTLTKYNKSEYDKRFINILRDKYDRLYFWPQGLGDYRYLQSITDTSDIIVIDPTVSKYSRFLDSSDVDYVGTRLHGGIHSIKRQNRTIILGLDNRAIEMGDDFCLPVVRRSDTEAIKQKIESRFEHELEIPKGNIQDWKAQFQL